MGGDEAAPVNGAGRPLLGSSLQPTELDTLSGCVGPFVVWPEWPLRRICMSRCELGRVAQCDPDRVVYECGLVALSGP